MAENSTNRPAEFSCFKEAVCINAQRIYDSCSDKDCLEDLQVFFSDQTQPIINKAISVKCKKVKILCVNVDVESVPFNKGFYSVDMTFYFLVAVAAPLPPAGPPVTVRAAMPARVSRNVYAPKPAARNSVPAPAAAAAAGARTQPPCRRLWYRRWIRCVWPAASANARRKTAVRAAASPAASAVSWAATLRRCPPPGSCTSPSACSPLYSCSGR